MARIGRAYPARPFFGRVPKDTPVAGLTSSPLKNNTGALLTSAGLSAYVHNPTTGALVLLKTGLTSHASTGVVTFTDASLSAATSYRVVWKITSGGAEGMETLTAA
jgi:hypothetical protein